MAIRFDIGHLVKTRWSLSHLRNTRIEGWDRILLELRTWWKMETETIIETSFYERLNNIPRQKHPMDIY
jgi:hypothetical protein